MKNSLCYSVSSVVKKLLEYGEDGNRFETIYDLKELYKVINAVPEELKKPFLMLVPGFK